MSFIIYFIGAIAAYFVCRWNFINEVHDGNMDEYTTGNRAIVIAFSLLSWAALASIATKLIVMWLITLPGSLNKRAKW
jgi:hypothetical protein